MSFIGLEELKTKTATSYAVRGDLVGPDNMGRDAEITWSEINGMPSVAKWTLLDVDELNREYSKPKKSKINVGKMPFKITWQPWWETNLPDFGIDILFSKTPNATTIRRLETFATSVKPAWHSLKTHGATVNLSFDFGARAPIQKNIVKLFELLNKTHASNPITKVIIGN